MNEMWLKLSGALLVAGVAYLFLSAVQGFTPFEYSISPLGDSLVSTEKGISLAVSYTLWDKRSLDVIILALLLFVTSACCAVILGHREAQKGG